MNRVLVWFSCGAASAVAADKAIKKYGNSVEVIYCDTLKYEHPDNIRFLHDVESMIGQKIKILKSTEYEDIYDVFNKTRWLVGPQGARCTTEMKKKVRFAYQKPDDIHVFGYTADEHKRIVKFGENNPELKTDWILWFENITKRMCYQYLKDSGIELPAMYKLGYKNNNCIGCVKGGAGYWNKIRKDFPEMFEKMAKTERELNVAINKKMVDGVRTKIFLDELPINMGNYKIEKDIECGVHCAGDNS